MATPRFALVSRVLLITGIVMALLGAYFLLATDNFIVGVALVVVAISDIAMSVVFARRV